MACADRVIAQHLVQYEALLPAGRLGIRVRFLLDTIASAQMAIGHRGVCAAHFIPSLIEKTHQFP
jgi:hypothetical protein